MKSALLFTLSFLLLAFTTISNLPLAFSQVHERVVDSQGVPLSPAGQYFVQPAVGGPLGGGVEILLTRNTTCPVTILQDFSEIAKGLPVKFRTVGSSPGIFTSTPLDIAFVFKPRCATSSNWVVVVDNFPGKWLGIGSAQDHPGKQVITGTFNFQKTDEGYKIVFCPSSGPDCSNIEEHQDENGKRLILTKTGRPFSYRFLNAAGFSTD